MLRFQVYRDGANPIDLSGAYVFGQEQVPVRADIVADETQITCMKRASEACGLAILWPTATGTYLLQTTRLLERAQPYNLHVELARAQIMKLYRKREDWGLFDHPRAAELNETFRTVRSQFVEAIKIQAVAPQAATAQAEQALDGGLRLGEQLALLHADLVEENPGAKVGLTCGVQVNLDDSCDQARQRLLEAGGILSVPMPWKRLEPAEREFDFQLTDHWMDWASRTGRDIHAGPLLSFDSSLVPDWLHAWKSDFESIKQLAYNHIQRIMERYGRKVRVWNVVSGLAGINTFDLNFEQITDLTRNCCQLAKRLAPEAEILIELALPFGEYYARNQRTIPPILYADMAVQADMKFDSFGIRLPMGVPLDGYFVRDLLQISNLLDAFAPHGKTVHVTLAGVPSSPQIDREDAWGGFLSPARSGRWHGPWSPKLQAEWFSAVHRLCRAKPFVETLCWRDLADVPGHALPHGGLCQDDYQPKPVHREIRTIVQNAIGPTGGPA